MFNMDQLKKFTKDDLVELYYDTPRSKRRKKTERPELFSKTWLIKELFEAQWARDVVSEPVGCSKCYCDEPIDFFITGPEGHLFLCEEHAGDFTTALSTLGVSLEVQR